MDETITSALLIIAAVVAAVLVVNATYPAIVRSSNAIVGISQRVDQRIETQVSAVYATGELDSAGTWQDADSDTYFDVTVWVKNVGSSRILGTDQMDIFFGKAGDFSRIPYVDDAGGSFPSWSYLIENGTEWTNTVTVKISIHYQSPLASDTYLVKLITPSGAYDERYFSF